MISKQLWDKWPHNHDNVYILIKRLLMKAKYYNVQAIKKYHSVINEWSKLKLQGTLVYRYWRLDKFFFWNYIRLNTVACFRNFEVVIRAYVNFAISNIAVRPRLYASWLVIWYVSNGIKKVKDQMSEAEGLKNIGQQTSMSPARHAIEIYCIFSSNLCQRSWQYSIDIVDNTLQIVFTYHDMLFLFIFC